MPCNHKFQEYLNLERLAFEPTTLIVGTFNPEWPENNQAWWFYGRTRGQHGNRNNHFLDVLPRLYGEDSLIDAGPIDWKVFCRRNKIALTDLISCVEDANRPEDDTAMGGYSDDVIAYDFHQHIFTPIVDVLKNNPTIKNVYLTREERFWTHLWAPIANYCNQNNVKESKILTPSKNARFSMFANNRKNTGRQFNMPTLNDYILLKWQDKWHEIEAPQQNNKSAIF